MKILQVIGARPQFMKYFPVARAIENNNEIRDVLVHTGHLYDYNMSNRGWIRHAWDAKRTMW